MDVVRHRFTDLAVAGAPYFAVPLTFPVSDHSRAVDTIPIVIKDYWDIEICLSGAARNHVRDPDGVVRVVEMRPGRAHLWRPQDRRLLQPIVFGETPAATLLVGFRPQEWQTFAILAGADPAVLSRPDPLFADVPGDARVVSAFDEVFRTDSRPTMVDLIRFWTTMIGYLLPTPDEVDQRAPDWLADAIGILQLDEADLRGGVGRLRELAHVSDRHLARLTRRWYGRSPTQLVEDLRIRRARHLLLASNETVTRISERCGFVTPAYFSTRFRRASGVSPRAFRESAVASE